MTSYRCPVCAAGEPLRFLHRTGVPVHQNLIVTDRRQARDVTRGTLSMVACTNCGFVSNEDFDLSLLSYGEDYDNTQSCSAYFEAYMDGLVEDLVERQGVRNATIVEVGTGKGVFLRKLVSYPGANNRGFGFDPSYVGPDSDLDGRLMFRRSYYDANCADVAADVVVSRHVIEHVPQPLELLKTVRMALVKSPKARVFFETPCVDWILRNRVVWDFFYEHCSLFTAQSLAWAFESTGFSVDSVSHIFGDQYLWIEAHVSDDKPIHLKSDGTTAALAKIYGEVEARLRDHWLRKLLALKKRGNVALWGAGAKGATFANMVDPDCELIDCVVDLNPKKQGGFIPGTGHPIVAPSMLPDRAVTSAVLMNPNYRQENLQLLNKAGIRLDLIDWNEE